MFIYYFSGEEDKVWSRPLSAKIMKLDHLEALQDFIENITKPNLPNLSFTISRDKNILDQIVRIYKGPQINFGAPLNVQFISSGTFEQGIDAGGPTKEYFSQLMNEIVRLSFNGIKLFEGEMGYMLPIPNYDLVSGHFFEMVGKMILHAVINKCKGIKGISQTAINYILSGNRESVLEDVTVNDVPDPCLRQNLSQVYYCHGLCTYINKYI